MRVALFGGSNAGQTRRRFLSALGACVFIFANGVRAQSSTKVWRVGYLSYRSGAIDIDAEFARGMRELGYTDGRNLVIEYRWAAGNEQRLKTMAAELVQTKVDVIVAASTPVVQAVSDATKTIPIVMSGAADPVGTGIVASLARPGGNVTGLSVQTNDIAGKLVELAREAVPTSTRVALLAVGPTPATSLLIKSLDVVARGAGIRLTPYVIARAGDIAPAFERMQRDAMQFLIVQASPFAAEHRKLIFELAARGKLPTISESRVFADAGGLLSYGPSFGEMYRRAATYVDKILRGAIPGDLPIEQPVKFELVINMRTAKVIGVTIPQSLLQRADDLLG